MYRIICVYLVLGIVMMFASAQSFAQQEIVFDIFMNDDVYDITDTTFIEREPSTAQPVSPTLLLSGITTADEGMGYAYLYITELIGDDEKLIPSEATLLEAVLEAYVVNPGNASEYSFFQNSQEKIDIETETWNSLGETLPTSFPLIDPVAAFTVNSHIDSMGILEFNAFPIIQELLDGAENHGFLIVPDFGATDPMEILSVDGATRTPALEVVTANSVYLFQNGVHGYSGVQDAHFNSHSAEIANGTFPVATIVSDSTESYSVAGIRFDGIFGEDEYQIGMEEEIVSATLRMTIISSGGTVQLREIQSFQNEATGVDTYFNQESSTFASFVNGGELNTDEEITADVAFENVLNTASPYNQIDVTATVKKWQDGSLDNYGWAIIPTEVFNDGQELKIIMSEATAFSPKLRVLIEGETSIDDFMLY